MMVKTTNTAKTQKEQQNSKKKVKKGSFLKFHEIYFWPIKILRLKKHKCCEAWAINILWVGR
jgi:hypothetical protein